jgi:hypothetical protein
MLLYITYILFLISNNVNNLSIGNQQAEIHNNNNNINNNVNNNVNNINNISTSKPEFLNLSILKETAILPNILTIVEINSIDTTILLKKGETDGRIHEKVKFVLKQNQGAIFNSLIRKVSLGGTAEKQFGFKLASSDVKLTGAKAISNCLESNSVYDHPYMCIIAKFEPIDSTTASIYIFIFF